MTTTVEILVRKINDGHVDPQAGDWIRETFKDANGNVIAVIEREFH